MARRDVPVDKLTARTLMFFMDSHDFNGIPLEVLRERTRTSRTRFNSILRRAIETGRVSVVFGHRHSNPHVRALPDEPVDAQLAHLVDPTFEERFGACVYPTTAILESTVPTQTYAGRPFSFRLALGEPQLSFEVFDLSVLEFYRNDPRYHYHCDDAGGSISIKTDHYESPGTPEADKIHLQTFGFAYDESGNRAIAVFLRYLSQLRAEHQQLWNAKRVKGAYKLHPAYYRSSILGEWYTGMSVFDAVMQELSVISKLCAAIGRPPLFRVVTPKPPEFSFLIRPTSKAFNDFVQLLDKLMSDNIALEFFGKEIPTDREESLPDGRVRVVRKGSIQIMEEWFRLKFRPPKPSDVDFIFEAFREVRKLRSRPAHTLDDNAFDQVYLKTQRELMVRVYEAIAAIRKILSMHPAAAGCEVPEELKNGTEIWLE